MRIKIFGAIALAIFLAGCQSNPTLIKEKLVSVELPATLTDQCKSVTIPNRNSYTNRDVANLINELKTMNVKCVNTIEAIKTFLQEVKVVVNSN